MGIEENGLRIDLEEFVGRMGGEAVRANAERTVETEDVFFVLFGVFVKNTGVEELVGEERLEPDG